jgi:hypothetical protein
VLAGHAGVTGVVTTVMVHWPASVFPDASAISLVKVKAPPDVGVPAMAPPGPVSVRPGGSEPDVREKV